jgi:hypothetical protein
MPLVYHAGQIAVQEEARTRVVADRLAHWVGPVAEFAADADLLLLATRKTDGALRFTTLAGRPPLVEVIGPATLRLRFPPGQSPVNDDPIACGGLAINLGRARRARINGRLRPEGDACALDATETFTLCRKYMAPSLALTEQPHAGPATRAPLAPDDPWLAALLARAETSFLASAGPDGAPDVAHRGGPPGFITFDPATRLLSWPEYLGDGVFKSAGNVRATNSVTLLVVDTESGDGVELIGRGDYANVRTDRQDRLDPLVRHQDPYPIQGAIRCDIERIDRVSGLMHPRRRIEKAEKVTSRSTVDEQAPR